MPSFHLRLEPDMIAFTLPHMRTVQEIETAISRLSPEDMRLVRDWLEHQLEDKLEMTTAFKARIEKSEREMAEGRRPRVR